MADIRPFRGHRYDAKRVSLTRALCPPYDVIGPEEARRLRRDRMNAIHLELPAGTGQARYRGAAKLWKTWTASGALKQDSAPSLYVCEERFIFLGRRHRRLGFLAALGVSRAAARCVVPHERTLPKPKADRLRMLKAVGANISPIFGVFPDPAGAVRRVLGRAAQGRPSAQGRTGGGVAYKLWPVSDAKDAAAVAPRSNRPRSHRRRPPPLRGQPRPSRRRPPGPPRAPCSHTFVRKKTPASSSCPPIASSWMVRPCWRGRRSPAG